MIAITRLGGALALLGMFAWTQPVSANDDEAAFEPMDRPQKIALVLEGGGALGFAHVGVLQVLEKYNVCPDAVVGTSMGAIVGGLYSSGYSAEELKVLTETIDWADLFDDTVPRQDLSYRRKQDDSNFLTDFRIGIRDGKVQSPLGLLQGEDLILKLRELLETRSQVSDFNSLPIPFRAVAVDLLTGQPYTLKDGNLAIAMRASMSVPGAFPPVKINGRLLIDGGVANNLPVEVALSEFQPDHIIAVRLKTAPPAEADVTSAVSVLRQTVSLMLAQNVDRSVELLKTVPHTLIEVDLTGYDSTGFDDAAELVRPGQTAAELLVNELQSLAYVEEPSGLIAPGARSAEQMSKSLENLSNGRCARPEVPPADPRIAFIELENTSPLSDKILLDRLGVAAGDRLDPEKLRKGLKSIYGIGIFELVDYEVVTAPDSGGRTQTGIKVTAKEKSTGLTTLRFGLNLENNFEGQTEYNVAAELTFFGVNSLGGESRTALVFGDDLSLFTEFFQPLSPTKNFFFVRPRVGYEATDVPVFVNGERLAEYRVRFAATSLDFGYQVDSLGEFAVSYFAGWGGSEIVTGNPALPEPDVEIGEIRALMDIDRLDDLSFPRKGYRTRLQYRRSLEAIGGEQEYGIINTSALGAYSFGPNTVLAGADLQYTVEQMGTLESRAQLGGLFNLSGLERNELSGEHSFIGRLIYYYDLSSSGIDFFNLPIYAGGSLEAGQVFETRREFEAFDLEFAGSAFVGLDTPLGPIYIAYGYSEGGRQAGYLFLGRSF